MGITKKDKVFVRYALLSLVSLVIYFLARLKTFFFSGFNYYNLLFAVPLLFAEGHSILHTLGFTLGAIRLRKKGVTYQRKVNLDKRKLPGVTVLVPARNEPLDVLELTFISLVSMKYKEKKVVFLDGSDEERQKENRKLAERYGVEYFHPEKMPGSKAEVINMYLPKVESKYIAVFDSDQNPMPEFLDETVALAEYSKNIGFVQTPQLYSNLNVSPIAKGAALQQSIFYESVCESKGSVDAMFCCGTNFLMRTKVLKEVGGFDETSVTEDFATSVKIHSLGYRSIYYPHVRVFGMAPETLSAYLKQQYRWSAGSVAVLRNLILSLLKGETTISSEQLWEYFLSATYYFTGWSFFILMICPALFLIVGVPTYFASPYLYIGTYVPYYVLTMATFYSTLRGRHYQITDVFTGIIMASVTYPVLMASTTAALMGKKFRFQITEKGKSGVVPFWQLWPWTSMMALNIWAIISGIFKFAENPYAVGINILWCTYHLFLLSKIFGFNKKPKLVKQELLNYVYK